jgi:predicted house-cleaning noncanonical NTP pyrophosphatase (MazG superfamily)
LEFSYKRKQRVNINGIRSKWQKNCQWDLAELAQYLQQLKRKLSEKMVEFASHLCADTVNY